MQAISSYSSYSNALPSQAAPTLVKMLTKC